MIQISDDPTRLDVGLIHHFLSEESAWAAGISLALVRKAISRSLCFGIYDDGAQIGFARVVTDGATHAYLSDVFVVAERRGEGLSRRLMQEVLAHPELQGLRRFMLASSTARGLYQKLGWTALQKPEIFMERHSPDAYQHDVGEPVAPG